MNTPQLRFTGRLVLSDRVCDVGTLDVTDGYITSVREGSPADQPTTTIDAGDGYIVPGFIDVHVHGGCGADFMDGTPEAFSTALRAHARHGTTSLAVTTTVARHDQILRALELTRQFMKQPDEAGARVLGAHFYGPYFRYEARGAHPGGEIRAPIAAEYEQYLAYADALVTCTVAPELDGAEGFVRACTRRGIRTNVGHSWATFDRMTEAVAWGVRHVDHLYCAMSDKTRLRQLQMYPMQGGVLEATFYFDELTTEVIADGKHLDAGLLLLAHKLKGPDKVALVTDANRALDMPDGAYLIGPLDGGEPLIKRDGVGMMPDGKALASSVEGMDHMLRTYLTLTGCPLHEVVRMATLTPARIAGVDQTLGSLTVGKRADIVVLDRDYRVQRVFRDGLELPRS